MIHYFVSTLYLAKGYSQKLDRMYNYFDTFLPGFLAIRFQITVKTCNCGLPFASSSLLACAQTHFPKEERTHLDNLRVG